MVGLPTRAPVWTVPSSDRLPSRPPLESQLGFPTATDTLIFTPRLRYTPQRHRLGAGKVYSLVGSPATLAVSKFLC